MFIDVAWRPSPTHADTLILMRYFQFIYEVTIYAIYCELIYTVARVNRQQQMAAEEQA